MDIVVKGRNVEVPEHYRLHVSEKLARLERYDRKVIRYDVELFHEPNRRQSKNCQRVEITGKGKGPAVRAAAAAGDFYAALDSAISKLENRLRRMHDRRRIHYGRRSPESVAEATSAAAMAAGPSGSPTSGRRSAATAVMEAPAEPATAVSAEEIELPEQRWDDGVADHEPGRIVREKQHSAEPMTVDQALYQMELVGHDFYLFNCSDTGKPSVVYRRKGFDYGVIRLG
ncbi:ribosome-associated translation inhibitor RaiA [Prauserella sp. PE36]|uniref:Ribosome hibernation promoting factor n=1 Tax=Prauserella endophytica TaxID=1592324 RepID=A0ABY2RTV8_9PSEU|nr:MULTISPECIES: ribosome-associated translation inhibitor RaiA [Prauserella]PXY26642.1 ribosomal subunit interface protein [Prauserella coralliicola]RBM10523.1 ribosome-associated translation inhibitor RaiA [Prauserella sp. PE36]TKG60443.1 ribosome-associated translation inhibitor RaiA [Prauserella endophytica]